ncbi:MAG: RCC1 domain-containing protein [Myxococcota bacterium]
MSKALSSLSTHFMFRLLGWALLLALTACQSSGDRERESISKHTSDIILKDVPRCADSAVTATLPFACSQSDLGKERLIRAEPYESVSSLRVHPGASYGVQLRTVPEGFSGTVEFKPPFDGDYLIYLGTPNINIVIDAATPSCSLYLSSAVTTRILGAGAETCANQFPGVYRVTLQAVERYQLRFGPSTAASWVRLLILPAAGAMKAQAVAAGYDHSCAILSTGDVKCWGGNDGGQLGLEDLNARGYNLSLVGDGLSTVALGTGVTATSLALGVERTCAVASDGRPKCWGANPVGELGYQDTVYRGGHAGDMGAALAYVSLGPDFLVSKLGLGDHHNCAIATTGGLKCWGLNAFAQLGLPHRNPRGAQLNSMGNRLALVNLGGQAALSVSGSSHHTCAALANGSVRCWGCSLFGQLGQGFVESCPSGRLGAENSLPVALGSGQVASAVTTGAEHSCAIVSGGQVKCWGYNAHGQLGAGSTENLADEPDEVGDALPLVDLGTGRSAIEIDAGEHFTCARLDDGSIKCWGDNRFGQLGLGDTRPRGIAPGEMGDALPAVALGTNRRATALSVGYRHVCVLLDDQTIKCWGNNHRGELGLGALASERFGDQPGEMGNALPSLYLGVNAPPAVQAAQ